MNDQDVVHCEIRCPAPNTLPCNHDRGELIEFIAADGSMQAGSSRGSRLHRGFIANALRFLIAAFVLATLASCAFAPGQSVREDSSSKYIQFVPITPQSVASNTIASATAPPPSALLDFKPQPYRIGVGDSLYITVWDHPELTSPAGSQQQTQANGRLVNSDGTLFYPYVGNLKVVGMTLDQLRQTLSDKLANYIKKPQVDVGVISYGSQHVSMQGAFTKPGPQPITVVPLTLAEALGTAAPDATQANLSYVIVTRDGQSYRVDLDQNASLADRIYLKAGDSVFLPYNDSQEVYLMGEVVRPMAVRFKIPNLTLTQALGQAGGLNEVTAKGMVYVIRGLKNPGYTTVYELDAKSPAAFGLADQFKVEPGDVVFASAAEITRWNRFISQLIPTTSALSSAAVANYYANRPN